MRPAEAIAEGCAASATHRASCILRVVNHVEHTDRRSPWAGLEPEVWAALSGQVERELAKRSISGAMVYFVVTVVLALTTTYFEDHPVFLGSIAALTLFLGIARIVLSRRLIGQDPAQIPRT